MPGVDQRVQLVREVAGADRYDRLELNALVHQVVVTDDRQTVASELTSRWPQLSADGFLQIPYVLVGTVDQMIEDLRARRERWVSSYITIRQPHESAFAPIVAQLAGT